MQSAAGRSDYPLAAMQATGFTPSCLLDEGARHPIFLLLPDLCADK